MSTNTHFAHPDGYTAESYRRKSAIYDRMARSPGLSPAEREEYLGKAATYAMLSRRAEARSSLRAELSTLGLGVYQATEGSASPTALRIRAARYARTLEV